MKTTMTRHTNPSALLLAAALSLAACGTAQADGGRLQPRNVPPAYTQECAACHTAFAPGLLPAASWQHIMTGLNRHYGTDASLDAATTRQLSDWLRANAGTSRRMGEEPPQDRITRSAWFVRKHREVSPATWQLPSVKSAANCGACHTGADRGDFDEDMLKVPTGLDTGTRRSWNH
jgi:mono/diheme cytochrome c family protein